MLQQPCPSSAFTQLHAALTPMIEFFFPNSRALLPTFQTNCPDWSHFAQIRSHFAQNTTTNPCFLLSLHKPLLGICTYTKQPRPHPKAPLFLAWICPKYHPQPLFFNQLSHTPSSPQNTPFPGLNLKVGKMNYCLGNLDPKWAKCFKSDQIFLKWAKNNYSSHAALAVLSQPSAGHEP